MPSPPREFHIPEELYSDDCIAAASLEDLDDLWPPLLDQAPNLETQLPAEAEAHHDIVGAYSAAENNNLETTFSSNINLQVSENHHLWLVQQESNVFLPPILLEHDLAYIATRDQDTSVAYHHHHHQVNPEPTVAAQENVEPSTSNLCAEKGKRKLDRELLPNVPSKWKKRGQKLKSLQIPNNIQLDHGNEKVGSVVAKKQDHNAKERVRRLKLNASYLALGALLPQSRRSSKKRWTAPAIIDKMVHYIPELKTEIEELKHKKDELGPVSSIPDAINTCTGRHQEDVDESLSSSTTTTVSVHEVSGREELIVQVCMKKKDVIKDEEEDNAFSYLVWKLEVEGFLLLGASTNNVGANRVCYNLHLQMSGSCSSHGSNYAAVFKDKVLSWLDIYSARQSTEDTRCP